MMKKIGIMGGTFDPFHRGHYMLARTAFRQFGLDKVLIMPNGNPPHKMDSVETDIVHRMGMIEAAICDTDYMELCLEERRGEEPHYTFQTLDILHRKYPKDRLYFIIGADSLFDFAGWRHPELIVKYATLLVASRDRAGREDLERQIIRLKELFGGEFLIMNSRRMKVASKEIRELLGAGKDVSDYLDENVCRYIRQHHLYEQP